MTEMGKIITAPAQGTGQLPLPWLGSLCVLLVPAGHGAVLPWSPAGDTAAFGHEELQLPLCVCLRRRFDFVISVSETKQ